MAESQLVCMDDEHVNVKIPESKPEFYYSEEQRAALEQLLRNGDGAFKMRLKEDSVKDFLSAREIKWMRETFQEYESDSDTCCSRSPHDTSEDSGVHSTYWPTMSDTEIPPLDIGWPSNGHYKGVTRVSVYTHPPKSNSPHIKEVVRKLIQESTKLIAVVMDLVTDLLILQDLLDAASKRGVAVYLLLEENGLPHFLDMSSRLQISAQHLRNLRVQTVRGSGMPLSFGRLPGSLCSKYMLVDGEKVMFGSYSFTWSSSRMNRNTITVMSGQIIDFFDNDFRELYAVSDKVDLYREFHISKPAMQVPVLKTPSEPIKLTVPVSMSRFQISVGDTKPVDLKVPAHKYHNPKYSLVVGNSLGVTGSLQDLSKLRDYVDHASVSNMEKLIYTNGESLHPQSPASPDGTEDTKGEGKKPSPFGSKKQRSSFRNYLKGRANNQSPGTLTKTTHQNTDAKQNSPKDFKPTSHSKEAPWLDNHVKEKEEPSRHMSPAPRKISDADSTDEVEDTFEFIENPPQVKFKLKKNRLGPRSVSLQTIATDGEDGPRGRRRNQKKNCIQS
ncbi:LOW QUALITY PROTEIN: protein FAM83F [Danio aesculapii]|uniref:LOW QUALITY PROTEIN: protein FAM83F n=1 Tax=Danio aesculapii TaxID=1142201 RepID=UPI0024C07F76|nr:LOW QUALITY PROTEIN: protein FAM83F [Danio aesculapii]